MDLSQVLGKLKSTVTGVKSQKLDQELDKAISDINKYRTFNGDRTYVDLVKSLINKLGSVSDIDSIINAEVTPATIGQQARLDRYKLYQDITEKISYCDRALKVLTDNILAPDDITKRVLEITSSSLARDEAEVEALVSEVKNIESKIKLDDFLDEIVSSSLHFGDYFVEISDTASATRNNTVIIEQGIDRNESEQVDLDQIQLELDLNYFDFNISGTDAGFQIVNEKNALISEDEPLEVDPQDIFLIHHHPKYVVRLQSERFDKVCLGYLVFPKYDYFLLNQTILTNTVDGIIAKIASVLDAALDTDVNLKRNKDIGYIVRNILASMKDQTQLKVRFVPIERMVHFRIGSVHKYFPYGQSIFDSIAFQAKLLIALQVANVIFRLSRSTEKRIIGVEIGLPRDARNLIEELKSQFRKRKINIDSFGTLDAIASNISTFEDIYLPMKDGKRFVEVDAGNFGGVDIRGRVDETKFLRDTIVAGLNVPPSFLGIEENLSNRAALAEENILFTRTVISYQRQIVKGIKEILAKCYSLVHPGRDVEKDLDKLNISFPVPKSLQFERESKYVGDMVNLIEALKGLGIPKDYLVRRYLTNLDWDDIKSWKIREKIDKTVKPPEEEEMAGGMAGGGGY